MAARPVSELAAELQGGDESAAIAASSALREKKDPAGLDHLIKAADGSEFASVRKLSTMALQWFADPKAIAAMVELMHEEEEEVVVTAKEGFDFAVGQNYTKIGEGMAIAKEESPEAYSVAFDLLKGMVNSTEGFKGSRASASLGRTGDPQATSVLVNLLKTGDESQQGKAAMALGGIDSPESVAALKEAALSESASVANSASGALRSLG